MDSLTRHAKVSYIEIPSVDIQQSATFYESVFGWKVEVRGDDNGSFDTGDLIGHWVTSLAPAREPGILPYVYVDNVDEAVEQITGAGGEMVKAPYPEGSLWVATFRDPAGNVLGIWQAGPRG